MNVSDLELAECPFQPGDLIVRTWGVRRGVEYLILDIEICKIPIVRYQQKIKTYELTYMLTLLGGDGHIEQMPFLSRESLIDLWKKWAEE